MKKIQRLVAGCSTVTKMKNESNKVMCLTVLILRRSMDIYILALHKISNQKLWLVLDSRHLSKTAPLPYSTYLVPKEERERERERERLQGHALVHDPFVMLETTN